MRAARAALVVSVLAVSTAGAHAQARPQQPAARPASGQPATLPPVRAQPPVRRQPAPAAQRPPAQRPAAQPAPNRPRATPAPAAAPKPAGGLPAGGTVPEKWEDITVETANSGTYHLPVGRGHSGPSVLHVQVLLNRAFFSVGMLDGRWGRNTQTAVTWLQAREGLPTTGTVDSVTYARLVQLAAEGPTIREHVLTEDEVRGPFVAIPADIYAHARLRCSCYESLSEKLTENFQVHGTLLQRLNPGVKLDSVTAGTRLYVPQVRDTATAPAGVVKQIVVSGSSNYLQALDSAGTILYHFAATLGATIDPSPIGDYRVTSIHPNPWWNYQPKLLAHVPDDRPNAMIPPGPNNAVGRVWMSLSAPHYGIHGTKSPETIGYAESAGCVRLTNWDVVFLSSRVPPGTPVSFREIRGRVQPADTAARPAVLGGSPDSVHRDSAAARPDTARRPAQPATARPDTARRPAQPTAADTARARPASPTTTRPASATSQPASGATRPASATTQPASATTRPAQAAPTAKPAATDTAKPTPRG
ncbi:MAG TPA: L,D-transpeptidase family protein [Longimicrobium sp.]|nr:L,D-transpeptidase family protein [Longimicrobium sp.]